MSGKGTFQPPDGVLLDLLLLDPVQEVHLRESIIIDREGVLLGGRRHQECSFSGGHPTGSKGNPQNICLGLHCSSNGPPGPGLGASRKSGDGKEVKVKVKVKVN